ncbi:hypothetical protein FEP83_05531 [Burkholderia multivorans]|nr:hypothetical protein [Burkholderia multivorans]
MDGAALHIDRKRFAPIARRAHHVDQSTEYGIADRNRDRLT